MASWGMGTCGIDLTGALAERLKALGLSDEMILTDAAIDWRNESREGHSTTSAAGQTQAAFRCA